MNRIAESDEERYNYDRIFTKPGPPQGMSEEQFQELSEFLRSLLKRESARTGDFGDDIFVHGSRGDGTAEVDADLDIGIRVSEERFEQLLAVRESQVKAGGDRWETLQEARERGRIHQGEVGLSGVSKQVARLVNLSMNLGFLKGVQISIIREAGLFDRGPFISLRAKETT